MSNFEKLTVWQKSKTLAVEVYRSTRGFPKEEMFGMTSQMRRAAISISSNLAEGTGRRTDPELKRFASIALGSTCELNSLLRISRELEYVSTHDFDRVHSQVTEVSRMLNGFIDHLKP